jgi:hypothetical protein
VVNATRQFLKLESMKVVFLKDHEGNKKGDTADVKPIVFVRLKKAGVVVRGHSLPDSKKVGRPKKADK